MDTITDTGKRLRTPLFTDFLPESAFGRSRLAIAGERFAERPAAFCFENRTLIERSQNVLRTLADNKKKAYRHLPYEVWVWLYVYVMNSHLSSFVFFSAFSENCFPHAALQACFYFYSSFSLSLFLRHHVNSLPGSIYSMTVDYNK